MSNGSKARAGFALSRQELALVAVTMVWGTTFLIIHAAMKHCGPLFFVGMRFAFSSLFTLLLFRGALRGLNRKEVFAGSAIGISIFVGYALQTAGLQWISSSKSAFITALYVPAVPLLQWLLLRRLPRALQWLGIALAFVGMVLLAGPQQGSGFGKGEFFTLLCAISTAAEIILIGHYAGRVDLRRVTFVQLIVTSVLAFACMPAFGERAPAFSWAWLAAAIGLGIASAMIQLAMNWAQTSVSPTRATLIYAGEPVWAGLFGRIAGERLSALALLGGASVVLGVIVSELKLGRKPEDAGASWEAEQG